MNQAKGMKLKEIKPMHVTMPIAVCELKSQSSLIAFHAREHAMELSQPCYSLVVEDDVFLRARTLGDPSLPMSDIAYTRIDDDDISSQWRFSMPKSKDIQPLETACQNKRNTSPSP